MKKFLDSYFEPFLYNLRYVIIIAVIFSMISGVMLIVAGSIATINSIHEYAHSSGSIVNIELSLIRSIDTFLFAIIMIVFSFGLYDLFISKLDPARKEGQRPSWMLFTDIDSFKTSLTKLVNIILIITFFELIINNTESLSSYEYLIIPIGMLLISGSYKLLHK